MEGAGPPRIDERRDAGGGDVDDECNEPPLPTPTSLLEGRGGEGLQAWWIIIRARQHSPREIRFPPIRVEILFYFRRGVFSLIAISAFLPASLVVYVVRLDAGIDRGRIRDRLIEGR